MEKKKCILYGFAVLSALTGITFAENLSIFGEGVDEEPIAVVETGATVEPEDSSLINGENIDENSEINQIQVDNELNQNKNNDFSFGSENTINGNIQNEEKVSYEDGSDLSESLGENLNTSQENQISTDLDSKIEDYKNNVPVEDSLVYGVNESENMTSESVAVPYFYDENLYGYATIENGKFVFYLNNEIYDERDLINNTWIEVKVNGKSIEYYVKDNNLVSGLQEIDGKSYFFDYMYELSKNSYNSWGEYGYYSGDDGTLQKGWITTEYEKYYFDDDYRGNSGDYTIDGKRYFLSYGRINTNYTYLENGTFNHFGNDGVLDKSTTINGDQWISVGSDWYYAKDQSLVINQLLQINNHMYGFDYSGKMYADTSFGMDDDYYRADKSGALIKGWYQENEYSNKYYYDSDYKSVNGTKTIDGKIYVFSKYNGLEINGLIIDDNSKKAYISDNEGLLIGTIDCQKNRWIKQSGNWYYVEDESLVYGGIKKINNVLYAFNNYKMLDNTIGDVYGYDEAGNWYNGTVKARSGGALVTSTWATNDNNTYYFGADGLSVSGIQIIDGKTYVFSKYNGLEKNGLTIDDNSKKAYISDNEGLLIGTIDCQKNGWIKQSGNWYYVEDESLVYGGIKKINNVLYAFNNYKMLDNTIGAVYGDDETGNWYSGVVKAKPGGALVISDWGLDGYNTYYFGANGLSVKGLQKIGNDYYYFEPDYNGRLAKDTIVNVEGAKWIRVDNSGKQIASFTTDTNGWKNVSNSDWVYVENNRVLKNELKTIGNTKYRFDYNGLMCRNRLYYDYTAEPSSEKNNYLYFGNDGASVSGWVNSNGEWYYFGDDFYGITGIRTIKNIVYAFNNLSAMRAKVTLAAKDGTVYFFDAKGMGTKVSPSAGFYMNQYYIDSNHKAVSGWHYINNSWYYFDPDTKEMAKLNYRNRPITIGKKSYVFDYDGKMLTGWVFDGNSYARADGSLMENGWLQINGSWYYFKDNLKQVGAIIDTANNKYVLNKKGNQYKLVTQSNGWIEFQGEWYYLDNGKFVVGNSKIINDQTYGFDYNGFMVKNTEYLAYYFNKDGQAIKNQWLEVRPKVWKYYDENGIYVTNGWKTIGNAKYYFGSNGIAKTSDTIIDGEICRFSSSGALIGTPTKVKNGWNLVDGYWYYSNNGTLYEYGLYTIDSNEYYFQDGRMKMGDIIYISDSVHYYATKDGSIAKNRWCGPQSQYYAQSDGNLKTGLITSSGKQYYIDPNSFAYIKDTSALDSKENKVFIADKSGVISQILDAKTLNGWVKASNSAYYLVLNHKFVTGTYESGNKLYWMNHQTGIMAENEMVRTSDGWGYADASGSITKNGWLDDVYFINGYGAYGPSKIDGKDYFFNNARYVYFGVGGIGATGPLDGTQSNIKKVYKSINGSFYYFDGKGNKKQISFKDGWNQYNGEWYYVGNSKNNGLEKINNVYYSFDNVGKMLTNQLVYDNNYASDYNIYNAVYFVDENGNLAKGWRYVNNQWYYFGDNYKAVTGIRKIDGKEYVFTDYGVML
ncbi:hypothetical protein AAK706_11630 [Erysipelotrichaceae bacterium 66-17]